MHAGRVIFGLSATCGAMFALATLSAAEAAPSRGPKHNGASRASVVTRTVQAAPVASARQGRPGREKPASLAARRGRGDRGDRGFALVPAGRAPELRLAAMPSSYGGGYLSCVPYARMATGMEVAGNGGDWWNNAAGLYARGQRPEVGSILSFRASGGMRLGHVAVVERLVSTRELTIHHSNWGGPGIRPGSVMRNVSVMDVSDANDWTAVRVQVGHGGGAYGRTYPTHGFIYNREEAAGLRMARAARGAAPEVAEATPHLRFVSTTGTGAAR